MKEEDVDWRIYHLIPKTAAISVADLVAASGFGSGMVETSLARLERSCLIGRSGGSVRLLSFGEALIRNQMKYDKDLPFTIEDGVIREKKKDAR